MVDLLIIGTDTNAGKTTLAVLWMAAFSGEYEYWKPLETGESDCDTVRRLAPGALVHRPCMAFAQAVAPLEAVRATSLTIPLASSIALQRPHGNGPLLVETFGGPFSPLNEEESQISLIQALHLPCVLVTPATVGAVGRIVQCLIALAANGVTPCSVAMIGHDDPFAVERIQQTWHGGPVVCIDPPTVWDTAGIASAAAKARNTLSLIRSASRERKRPEDKHEHSDVVQRDRQAVWHPYTSLGDSTPPLVCVGAQDEFLHLADGRRVIDAISSWWTILLGHRHPVLMAALRSAANQFDHVHFAGVTHEPAVQLAEMMLQTSPWPTGRLFFSDNGSTAVEVALKMAYQYWCHQGEPQRTRFVGFEYGYHGDTFGAMAVGRDPLFFGRFEPLLFQSSVVPLSPDDLDQELTRHHGSVAAVIVEPLVQGAGGMRMHTPNTLRDLADVSQRHGALFIADEVMTGGGRTGSFWAHSAAQIVPDLICAGKTLAGGVLPLAATLAAPRIVQAFQTEDRAKTFFHGHSFTAHHLACAVAVANWGMLPDVLQHEPSRIENYWRRSLLPLMELPQVHEVRIQGTIAALELAGESGYLAKAGNQVRLACLDRGVLLRPLGNVVYAMPPLLTSDKSLEQIASAIEAGVRQL